ncbi:hypothetical protein SAMN05421753_12064 [Planctomicrobium piriforme]|uniref:Uncharacterized protein n=1 Tax=Planctomicrobium piriforme TaxID=1576369 RepID=A0A1I3RAM6_9PLAN|nr:hypothetical protein SAMN05421753_12064 [Planctomicrobium piriforme]
MNTCQSRNAISPEASEDGRNQTFHRMSNEGLRRDRSELPGFMSTCVNETQNLK